MSKATNQLFKIAFLKFFLSEFVYDTGGRVYAEPYQPHSIPPIGGGTLLHGAQNSVPSPFRPPEKASIPQIEI